MECKFRCINFRRVSEPRRALLPAFRVTGGADDKPGSTWERQRQSWECRRQVWEHLRAPTTQLGAPVTSLVAPRITVTQSGKQKFFFGNAAGGPGNHSYYLSFNDFYSVCILIYVSMSLYSCPSTHGISGLAAGGA